MCEHAKSFVQAADAPRLNEKLGYSYDEAHNLSRKTNNALVQTLNVNSLNQLTTATRSGTLTVAGTTAGAATNVTVNGLAASRYADNTFAKDGFSIADGTNSFTASAQDSYGRTGSDTVNVYLPATASFQYDDNGNLLSDGAKGFEYDDENQLVRITATNSWKSEFVYDGLLRRRVRKEFTWQGTSWVQSSETHYVYDGMLPIQERDGNNAPQVTYTRGLDLSSTLDDAGGIGGMLARTDSAGTSYYHADGSGNITTLINNQQVSVAKYLYDPFGKLLSLSGPLAEANTYRFSSKDANDRSGLVFFGYRYYEPNFQRWLNQDPLGEEGGINLYQFIYNDPMNWFDPDGQNPKRWRDQALNWLNNTRASKWAGRQLDKGLNRVLDLFKKKPELPKPPGWNPCWEKGFGTRGTSPRWFDPKGGEWRRHVPDKWHPQSHWDYNPWRNWNDSWRNVDDAGNLLLF